MNAHFWLIGMISGTPGMREPENALERRLLTARHLDFFFTRYGWTLNQYMDQPRWLLRALEMNAAAEMAVASKQAGSQAALAGAAG